MEINFSRLNPCYGEQKPNNNSTEMEFYVQITISIKMLHIPDETRPRKEQRKNLLDPGGTT